MNTRHMITSIQEHNKIHLLLDCPVVLFQEELNLLLERLQVLDLLINTSIDVDAIHKVGK